MKARTMKTLALGLTLLAAALANPAQAAFSTYSDKAAYLADSGATQATQAYGSGVLGTSVTSGSVTFNQVGPSTIAFGDWTSRLPGNEISTSSFENLDVVFATPVQAFGFDFVEPQFDPNVNASFVDSTFTITLLQNSTVVGSFTFNVPNDTAAFVGAISTVDVTAVQIRETTGGIENEFFGQFYTASLAPVPEPAGWALWLAGLAGGAAVLRRRRPR
jgi:hypothetical protein